MFIPGAMSPLHSHGHTGLEGTSYVNFATEQIKGVCQQGHGHFVS
jgi:hypothetical protein